MLDQRKRQPNVLVVGTSDALKNKLDTVIEQVGVRPRFAASLEVALDELMLCRADLALADLGSLQQGMRLMREVRRNPLASLTPVVLMAKDVDATACQNAFSMGAQGILEMPFHRNELIQTLQDFCHIPFTPANYEPVVVGILCDCDVNRHLLRQVLIRNGYNVAASVRPEQWLGLDHTMLAPVQLWIVNLLDPEEDENWIQFLAEQMDGAVLYGMGLAPLDETGRKGEEFRQWERRLINKIEVSFYGKVISRGNQYLLCGGARRSLAV